MITLDGSLGEGGGQILRSALALSVLTQQPFRIHHIRANRKKSGLRQQHLTAVRAAAHISNATLSGDAIGSGEIFFQPKTISPGRYEFNVGTAGSTSLVLQTILPPLLTAGSPSTITIKGGTHNPFAPPFPFLEKSFLPILQKMGFHVQLVLQSHGFFPAGGGEIVASIKAPSPLQNISLLKRGHHISTKATALSSNLPKDITSREISTLSHLLKNPLIHFEEQNIRSAGPGNVVWISSEFENITATFTGFGQRGKSVKKVVDELATEYNEYVKLQAPVGPHLADQLLVPMAMVGGGEFITSELTMHTRTNIDVLWEFLSINIESKKISDTLVLIRLSRST